jgi:hypothetical protein
VRHSPRRVYELRSIKVESWSSVVDEPTAKHRPDDWHVMPNSWLAYASAGFAVGTIDQLEPFHVSASVSVLGGPCSTLPTAVQFVALTHATPVNTRVPKPSGLGTIDHVAPFHRSMIVLPLSRKNVFDEPTAKQFVVDVHATLFSEVRSSLEFGLATSDHVVPFQRSTIVLLE